MNYEELKKAIEVFGLFDGVSLKEIKRRHRDLVKEHHPDSGGRDAEFIREINIAYKILLEYCESYKYSFSEEEFYRQHPEEFLIKRYMSDPIWGIED